MRVISNKKLREFWERYPESEKPLKAWAKVVKHGTWSNFAEIREVYAHADQVDHFTVFNIGGNKFRLIVHVHFNKDRLYIHDVLTHDEYDEGKWRGG